MGKVVVQYRVPCGDSVDHYEAVYRESKDKDGNKIFVRQKNAEGKILQRHVPGSAKVEAKGVVKCSHGDTWQYHKPAKGFWEKVVLAVPDKDQLVEA